MTMRDKADLGAVNDATRDALAGLALGDVEVLGEALERREALQERSGLDARTFALIRIAALVAIDAPPASYLWQVSNAINAGATPEDILEVLRTIAPQVGSPRVVAAAPEIMVALGLSLPEEAEGAGSGLVTPPALSRPPGTEFNDDEDDEDDEDRDRDRDDGKQRDERI